MAPLEIPLVWVGLVLDEQAYNHRVTLQTCGVQRSLKHLVPCVNFGAFIDQIFDKVRVTLLHSVMKGRLVIGRVNLGQELGLLTAPSSQELHDSICIASLA